MSNKNKKIMQYLFDPQDFDHLGPENEEDNELCDALENSLQEIDANMVPVAKKMLFHIMLFSYCRIFHLTVLQESIFGPHMNCTSSRLFCLLLV